MSRITGIYRPQARFSLQIPLWALTSDSLRVAHCSSEPRNLRHCRIRSLRPLALESIKQYATNGGRQPWPVQILKQIGAGGGGEVYRARDTRLGRDVITPSCFVGFVVFNARAKFRGGHH